jgi:hypothetical protein
VAADTMNLFEPDSVLPDQFASKTGRAVMGPERTLMLAVLQDAVDCYQKYALARDARGTFEFQESRKWIESVDRDWPFSYENICDVLGIDPDAVRDKLRTIATYTATRERLKPTIVPLLIEAAREDRTEQEAEALKAAS